MWTVKVERSKFIWIRKCFFGYTIEKVAKDCCLSTYIVRKAEGDGRCDQSIIEVLKDYYLARFKGRALIDFNKKGIELVC